MAVNLLLVGVLFLELEIGLFTQMAAATYRYPKRKKKATRSTRTWDGTVTCYMWVRLVSIFLPESVVRAATARPRRRVVFDRWRAMCRPLQW